MKRHSIKDINQASVLIFDSDDFCRVKVDKKERRIYRLKFFEEDKIEDITDEIYEIASRYTIGDIVIDAPYTLGVFLARVLNGVTNRKCINWLKLWDSITLE